MKGTKEPKSLNFAGQHLTTLKMEVLETITITAQAVTFLVLRFLRIQAQKIRCVCAF